MTLTKATLNQYCKDAFIVLSASQEKEIIGRFGSEPDERHVWTEQDIHEQIRKMRVSRTP